MCSIPVTVRPRLCTICTAVAPDPVGTFRMNDVTGQGYRLVTPTTTNPLANPSTSPKNPEDGTSQEGGSGGGTTIFTGTAADLASGGAVNVLAPLAAVTASTSVPISVSVTLDSRAGPTYQGPAVSQPLT